MDFWVEFEEFLGEKIPCCVKKTLEKCGYNSLVAVQELNEQKVCEIENYVKGDVPNVGTSSETSSCFCSSCLNRNSNYRFSPGHRLLVTNLSNYAKKMIEEKEMNTQIDTPAQAPATQPVSIELPHSLEELLEQANSNEYHAKPKYSQFIREFSTYTYLLGGKMCYDFLSSNLPMPSKHSVREYTLNFALIHT